MTTWANASVLDGGSDLIRTLAGTAGRVKQHIVKAYAAGDSYATVIANSCAVVDMAAADFAQSSSGANRLTTVAAKAGVSVTANSGAAPNLHAVVVDSTGSAALVATDETSDQVLVAGNTVNIPAWVMTWNQPTA